ncbi:hypothetical protein [Alkalihalobacillus sp. 1P02AB]|uniref:hypothetical protein n=1 Tax=Alkalihalobacillus sp. 1P02AB TaxID=3132260 RepID=UPI0039A5394E
MVKLGGIIISSFNELKYKRGYLLTDLHVEIPNSMWVKLNLGKFNLYYDPLNKLELSKYGEDWLVLLGYTIDVKNNTSDSCFIANKLLACLYKSDNEFYEYLDYLSGRHIIIYQLRGKIKVLSDATGLKSIVYSMNQNVIASHVNIVKDLTRAKKDSKIKDEWKKEFGGYYIPGHYTPYENIYFLTPNTYLDLETKKVIRFFPRENLNLKPVKEVAELISESVRKQFSILSIDFDKKIIFSLTAGMDSRTTLSLCKEITNEIDFFTYYKVFKEDKKRVKSLEIDKHVVEDIVYNLGLKHSFLPLRVDEVENDFSDFVKIMSLNSLRPHNFKLAKFYYEKFSDESIHIRSNILEIGRYFYREKIKLPRELTSEGMASCYSKNATDNKPIQDLFNEYSSHVNMKEIYNYDPYDILYWEYRMGIWHSQLLLESDVSHDTFIPFNSRHILKLFLSVSENHKKNYSVFKEITSSNWPILDYWGINTIEKPIDRINEEIDNNYGLDLKEFKFNSNVSFKFKKTRSSNKFLINKSDPQKGEFVECYYNLQTKADHDYLILLNVRSPYENKKNIGRMKYQVLLNENVFIEEDISQWQESNTISIPFRAEDNSSKISIRIVAIRDCEKWSWGRAGTLIIERLIFREVQTDSNFSISTSSPFSKVTLNN